MEGGLVRVVSQEYPDLDPDDRFGVDSVLGGVMLFKYAQNETLKRYFSIDVFRQMIPDSLLTGYSRFRGGLFKAEEARYRELAGGQAPSTMIIACADSRVDPATIFSAAPGDLFVVRNVAALVPPCETSSGYHGTSAALEFAMTSLPIENIVVLGHSLCGGVAASLAAAQNVPAGAFIGPWVELLSGLRDEVLGDTTVDGPLERQRALEWMGVMFSIGNLRTFPFVREAEQEGRLTLHGAWFSIAEAELYWHTTSTGLFEPVSSE
jgi:carbonic anhydrase